ncbi:hypothetical protein BH23PLA1_BH23PLA1_40320 [soil metagenome]
MRVIRYTLDDPQQVGHGEEHVLITNLFDEKTYPANELIVLDHERWEHENGLHYIKDRSWDEDRQWSTRPGLAERMAMLRDAALTALRLLPDVPADLPIRARADHLGRKLQKALRFIGAWD